MFITKSKFELMVDNNMLLAKVYKLEQALKIEGERKMNNENKTINEQIMDKLAVTFEVIRNHEKLDTLSLKVFSDLEREFQSILNTYDPPYIMKSSK